MRTGSTVRPCHRSVCSTKSTFRSNAMPPIDFTARELTILEFVLMDLAEAIDDGDRPEFNANEVDELMKKVQAVREKFFGAQTLIYPQAMDGGSCRLERPGTWRRLSRRTTTAGLARQRFDFRFRVVPCPAASIAPGTPRSSKPSSENGTRAAFYTDPERGKASTTPGPCTGRAGSWQGAECPSACSESRSTSAARTGPNSQ